jgi:hypothetical protein
MLVYLPPHARKESAPSMRGVVKVRLKRAKNFMLTNEENGGETDRKEAQQAYRPA